MEQIKTVNELEETSSLSQSAIRAGVILGLISTSLTFLLYFVDYTLLAASWMGLVSMALMIGVVIYFGFDYRKEIGGFISFGKAFQFSFIALVMSSLIASIGSLLLFNVVDPNLPVALGDVQFENALAMMERFGAAGAMNGDQMDEMRNGLYDNYSVMGVIKSFGVLIIISAVLSLIIGAVIKKRDKSLDM
ncbi:DUF4199 domain-containing protein [Litoribacter alkaliphilus]|uniref:DUF4199 domain-containing protein n=1 Tax=Litoribacter ruber TaxID=702568 RepID=A0AAP2CJU4_9BACT|nr:DUF4199 domain-containing protein [Litoribacter alkaliphilus]MBS9523107.1 DUF4199 domain-containing protein [Litoribacter alkaliphilus]